MNTATAASSTASQSVASGEQWLDERKALLDREKELTRLRDDIARARRALPWTRIAHNVAYPMEWVRHHDRYEPAPIAAGPSPAGGSCCHAAA